MYFNDKTLMFTVTMSYGDGDGDDDGDDGGR